jgi:hypothetical protein
MKRGIIIGAIICAILVLVLVSIYIYEKREPPEIKICNTDLIRAADCLTNIAIKNRDISICSNVKAKNLGVVEPICEGEVKGEESFCDKYNTAKYGYKEGSYQYCLWGVAVAKGDIEICKTILPEDRCIEDVAYKLNNGSICNFMRSIRYVNQKYGNPDTAVDACLMDLAKRTKNPGFCEGIFSKSQKDNCYYHYNYSL